VKTSIGTDDNQKASRNHISPEEIENVLKVLPESVREIFEQETTPHHEPILSHPFSTPTAEIHVTQVTFCLVE